MIQQTTIALVAIIVTIGIATIPLTQNVDAQSLIPDWIKNNAKWWADDLISDEDFVESINYLVKKGIIRI